MTAIPKGRMGDDPEAPARKIKVLENEEVIQIPEDGFIQGFDGMIHNFDDDGLSTASTSNLKMSMLFRNQSSSLRDFEMRHSMYQQVRRARRAADRLAGTRLRQMLLEAEQESEERNGVKKWTKNDFEYFESLIDMFMMLVVFTTLVHVVLVIDYSDLLSVIVMDYSISLAFTLELLTKLYLHGLKQYMFAPGRSDFSIG